MHMGHNLGFCELKRLIYSRFTYACELFEDRGFECVEAIYGFQYRAVLEADV